MLGWRKGDGKGEFQQEYPLGVFLRVVFKYLEYGGWQEEVIPDLHVIHFFIERANRDNIDTRKLSSLEF